MKEKVTLVFGDGVKFVWRTWKLGDARKAMKMQKKHGHPIDIIGDGVVAQTLREKYEVYNTDPQNYRSDLFGTASKFSGQAKAEIKRKLDRISRRLRLKKA